jgi:hypothetical protein
VTWQLSGSPTISTPADYYISFDTGKTGKSIGQSLVDHLKETDAQGRIPRVNGSPTDAAAGLIKGVPGAAGDPVDVERLTLLDLDSSFRFMVTGWCSRWHWTRWRTGREQPTDGPESTRPTEQNR